MAAKKEIVGVISKQAAAEIEKIKHYVDAVKESIKDSELFDSKVIDSNDNYIKILSEADTQEYTILQENLKVAKTEEEREKIRKQCEALREQRYKKADEHKEFNRSLQEDHRNSNLKLLGSVLVATGLVKHFGKPLINQATKLLKKV